MNFLKFLAAAALLITVLRGGCVALTSANSHWNCNSWHDATGDETKVVAAECMVHNPRTGRWEIYTSYIRDHHVGLHDDDKQ